MKPLKPNNTVASSCYPQVCLKVVSRAVGGGTQLYWDACSYPHAVIHYQFISQTPYTISELYYCLATEQSYNKNCLLADFSIMKKYWTLLICMIVWMLMTAIQPVCSSTLPVTGKLLYGHWIVLKEYAMAASFTFP